MSYSVSKLKTVSECDQAIADANAVKADLQFEQTVSGRELSDQESAVVSTTASLLSVKAQITGTEAAIEVMVDGKEKDNEVSKLRRLNDRKDNLEERLKKGGATALLNAELEAELTKVQITAIDAYVAEITTHKATL